LTESSIDPSKFTLIVEQPALGTLVVSGPDRKTWLNGLVTCEVANLEPGQGAFGLALTKQGKIVSDLNVVAGERELFVSVAPGAPLFEALEAFLIMEDATLADRSTEFSWLTLHGPSAAVLAATAGGRGQAIAAPIDWTGLGGAAIVVPRPAAAELARALAAAGSSARLSSAEEFEAFRIERGLPRFGVDYDARDNPHDASLERRAVSWTKGCYLGQEVVCMQDMRGKAKRRLLPLGVEGSLPAPGTPVLSGAEEVGRVTSSAESRGRGKPVVMARLVARAADEGELSIGGRPAERIAPRP
jgi:tRNA-modifying protein YgfZ